MFKPVKFLFLALAVVSGTAVVCLTGAALYNDTASKKWLSSPPAEGTVYQVGGAKIFARIQGAGAPSFVILQGEGSVSSEWAGVCSALSKSSAVLRYDRPGYGKSGPVSAGKSVDSDCNDLKKLLELSGAPGPYILIGHSYGGLCAIRFAESYPALTAGVILVETVPPGKDKSGYAPFARTAAVRSVSLAGRLGFYRLAKRLPFDVPFSAKQDTMEFLSRSDLAATLASEERAAYSAPAIRSFPALPLVLICRAPGVNAALLARQSIMKEYLALSPRSLWLDADKAGGDIHLDRPDLIEQAASTVLWQVKK